MRDPFPRDIEFKRLVRGDQSIDLARVNLEVARDAYPDLDPEDVLARIDVLSARVGERCPRGSKPLHVIGQINWVLFVEEEFRGNVDDYYDPRNSYLNDILDRKLGIPISLSILYLAVASRVGLTMAGVNLPVHFLLRVVEAPTPLLVDPFHSGRALDFDACERFLSEIVRRPYVLRESQIVPCDASTTVSRMLRNLKNIYLERESHGEALPVTRRLAALNPGELAEVRDWGTTSLQAGRPGEAMGPLERYVRERPDAPDVETIRTLLKVARREVARRN
ncbi:SirB1 family protein [Tundrisphaera lichenicola]|uniref:SirB1 family protein n=1 Tax=Tundrisphaera lichenicola TaxID=2029860 RepID=UPI003EBE0047